MFICESKFSHNKIIALVLKETVCFTATCDISRYTECDCTS